MESNINDAVLVTDIKGLLLLGAGRKADNVTELLSSDRGAAVLARLVEGHKRRIVILDSPPALAASPASVLAGRVGEVILVVRADRTTEADVRQAAALLSAAPSIRLLLNGVSLAGSAGGFGSYYGYGS